jgi:hypothetical protein
MMADPAAAVSANMASGSVKPTVAAMLLRSTPYFAATATAAADSTRIAALWLVRLL